MKRHHNRARQAGYLMMEVLITMFVLVIGLLGLAGLQARAHQAETESYQRVQALVLLRDMADRINANRANAANYLTPTTAPLGNGATKDCSGPVTTADVDLCDWSAALLGAGETLGGTCDTTTPGNCAGAMIGARGCITSPATNVYLIEVAWQGLNATAVPPAALICGSAQYGN
jgi:type IV pilus assembly protein PilV